MKQLAATQTNGSISPAVHLEFIQNQAALPAEAGLGESEAYHRAIFLHHHAQELERFQQESRIHEDRLNHLEDRLKDAHAKLGGVEKLVAVNVEGEPDVKPTSPWNLWDRAMFVGSGLAVAGLLVFGVLNISFNLLESGLVTFVENPFRAYFWAALLPVGALTVKVGWDFLQDRRKRDAYLWLCLCLGIVGVLVWVAAYSTVYPTLSKTTTEQIQSLSVFDQADIQHGFFAGTTFAGAKVIDAIIVASQAMAEIFLSAVLGMYMTTLYSKHRPVRLAYNPLFTQFDEERRLLEESVARERIALAESRGSQTRLESQLTALTSYAKSIFQKEVALRRDQSHQKQRMLDQISEQLRTQLQTFENGLLSDRSRSGENSAEHNGK